MKRIRLSQIPLVLMLVLAPLTARGAVARPGYGGTAGCASACVTEYALPPASAGPFGITRGPDGAIWFSHGDKVGRGPHG